MSTAGIAQIVVFTVVLLLVAYPLGLWMARVFTAERLPFGSIERGWCRLLGIGRGSQQDWKRYASSVVALSLGFVTFLYAVLRLQGHLPLNPDGMKGVSPQLALNTAASFLTNTNWQFYAGESTMSYLSQMAALAVQNFVSAAVGLAVLAAVIRGFARRTTKDLGNFWVDLYRALFYILLPLAIVVTVILIAAGVPQTFAGHATAHTLQGQVQQIARGPVASQIAIKHVGTNGGGFYNANSATPFESPSNWTGMLELLFEMLIPAASVFMFGRMIGSMRQAGAILAAMVSLFAVGVAVAYPAEQHGSPVLRASGVSLAQGNGSPGGNMEGKEVRYGISESALFATGTTDTSTGAVIAGHDSFTAAGGSVLLMNMFVGEVIFGGVGSGLYGMLLFVLLAVFIAGLMVGRTPEYLGKKIEAREVKLAVVGSLFVPILVLVLTALSVVTKSGLQSIFNSGAHGFTETLYAYTSQGNNNGSAFAGFGGTTFSDLLGALAMYLGRFVPIVAVLAVAGSLAAKRAVPASAGTFRTDSGTFAVLLAGVIVIVAGLVIFPALALGPLVEALARGGG